MIQKYKNVLIVGDDINVSQSVLKQYKKPGYLVIGDKDKGFTLDDLAQLNGNIDENTRVDIYAHGYNSFFNQHYLCITSSSSLYTKDVFKKIAFHNSQKPVYIHLWSCYANFTAEDANVLPKNSVLVAHAEKLSFSPLVKFAMEQTLINSFTNLNPFEAFFKDFIFESIEGSTFSVSQGWESPDKFVVNPPLKDVLENPRDVTREIQQNFINFYNNVRPVDSELAKKFSKELAIKAIPDDQLKNFVLGSFTNKSGIGSNDVVEVLSAVTHSQQGNIINGQINGFTALYNASQQGHLKVVNALIASGSDVNKANDDGCTALYIASENGHLQIVNTLIAAGADVNKANDDGCTPLYIASQNGHLEVVKALIAAGADVNKANDDGCTPLYIATQNGNLQVVKALIAAGADVDKATHYGFTPLYVASQNGNIKIVKALIAAGADVNKASYIGCTPNLIAYRNGHYEVLNVLTENGAIPVFSTLLILSFLIEFSSKMITSCNHYLSSVTNQAIEAGWQTMEFLSNSMAGPALNRYMSECRNNENSNNR